MRTSILIIAAIIISACNSGIEKIGQFGGNKITIKEVIQASAYTYLHAQSDDGDKWLAIPKTDAKVGDVYYYSEGLQMNNFESKDLERTFEKIYFVNKISKDPILSKEKESPPQKPSPHASKPKAQKKEITIEAVEGGITIAELFSGKKEYSGKKVKIKGQVTKYNAEIMGKNWIHLQDGTDDNGEFDLTVTSDIEVTVGDIVCVEGKVILDKDFGHGYSYTVIMEEAALVE